MRDDDKADKLARLRDVIERAGEALPGDLEMTTLERLVSDTRDPRRAVQLAEVVDAVKAARAILAEEDPPRG